MQKHVKVFFIFILVVCNAWVRDIEGAVYEKYVDEVVNPFVKDMKKKYGLDCIASGGTMPRNVERISLRFYSYQRNSLEEARELVVKLKEELIARVNAHEKIRPFLKEYPFTWVGADISIAFHKPKSASYYLDGSVAFVCSGRLGKDISYSRAESRTRERKPILGADGSILLPGATIEEEVFVDILQETCEEAARIVHSKDKEKPRSHDQNT